MPPAPSRIGRYHVLGILGQGAMGVVYRGRDEGLDRDVAVKVIRADSMEDAQARFLREARAAARLQHPHIVTIYELGEHEGTPFMAMELLEGQDLLRSMKEGSVRHPALAGSVILQTLDGLGHAHARGIVHRDVKPSNIFLLEGRQVKLLDFGVARLGEGMTVTGQVLGTPHYMSPEQVRADPLDGRSDLFSVALILYEMVTGVRAYRADSVMSVLYKIANEPPDLSLLPDPPEWRPLGEVFHRALARDRDARYPDARAMGDALTKALAPLTGHVPRPAPSPAAPIEPTLVDERPSPPAEPAVTLASSVPDTVAEIAIKAPAAVVPDLLLRPGDTPSPRPAPPRPLPTAPRAATGVPSGSRRGILLGVAAVVVLAAGGTFLWTQRPAAGPERASPDLATTLPAAPATVPSPLAVSPSVAPFGADAPSAAPTSATPVVSPPAPSPAALHTPRPPAEAVDVATRLDRANALYEEGRLNSALGEARAVLRADPANAEAAALVEDIEVDLAVEGHLKAARTAAARGDLDAARQAVQDGLRLKPHDSRLITLQRELAP
jgi:serine/threonine-protein kinase